MTDTHYVHIDGDTVSVGSTITTGGTMTLTSNTCARCGQELRWSSFWKDGHYYCSRECMDGPHQAQAPALMGWICPKCGRGNSPFAQTCPCTPMHPWTVTSGDVP